MEISKSSKWESHKIMLIVSVQITQSRSGNGGGLVMLGRSDGVLNPGGIRFGPTDIYSVLENDEYSKLGVEETLVVGLMVEGGADEKVILFVKVSSRGNIYLWGSDSVDERRRKAWRRIDQENQDGDKGSEECSTCPIAYNPGWRYSRHSHRKEGRRSVMMSLEMRFS
jgi:hypothetical protein